MISPETIQQITSRIDIIDVVGEFVKLKKRGANYLGLCPFHNEKTPSFTVSPAKEIYKCFGCGKSGNTISFLMEAEKYSYVEALKWLANRYGIEVEETYSSPEVRQQQLTADSLFAINNFAQKFFNDQLTSTDEGQTIGLSYLKEKRGFRDETIQKFQLGYNPEARNTFATAATQHQFNAELLVKSGLVVQRNEELIDNYRGRIIFPIHNNTGKIIGFGARIIAKNDRAPKYINTPENEIYIKSKILYGSYFARHAIDKNDECLLVEGYTDVISLHQNGIENVVASGGTSLTTDQLRIIKKYTNNLTIIYDGDAAGVKAALRGLDMALEESLNVKLVLIPDNEDPDSYVNKVGPTAFQKFIAENKKDFILFQLEVMLKEAGNDINKKNEVVQQIAATLSKINKTEDFTKQQEYIRQCSAMLKIDETGLTNLVNQNIKDRVSKEEKMFQNKESSFYEAAAAEVENPFDYTVNFFLDDVFFEREMVRILIEHGHKTINGEKVSKIIEDTLAEYPLNNNILARLVDAYNENSLMHLEGDLAFKGLLYHSQDEELKNTLIALSSYPHDFADWKRVHEHFDIGLDKHLELTVASAVNHYKLRKIKRMYLELKHDFIKTNDESLIIRTIKIYKMIKEIEMEIAKQTQTVITGFNWS